MIRTLLKEVKEYKAASIATPFFMILEVLFETLIPFLMASIIDKGVNTGDIHHIYKVGGIMIVAAFCGLLAGMAGGRYGAKASTGFAKNLRNKMFDQIQTYSFANIDHFSTAGLVTRLTTDVTNVQNAYQMMLRMMMRAPASMICAMVMAFTINARLASIYLVAVVILGVILFFIIRHATAYFQQAFPKYDALNASVQENVSAIRVVKAYVREEQETSKFQYASKNIYDIFVRAEKNVIWNSPIMMFTVYTCIILISWFGAKMIVVKSLTTGELMSLLAYCMNILMSLMMLSMVFVMISMSMASMRRIAEVLDETSDIHNPEHPLYEVADGSISFGVIVAFITYVRLFTSPLSQIAQAMTSLQSTAAASERVFEFVDEEEMTNQSNITKTLDRKNVKGKIEFKNVVFQYDNNDKPTIKDFTATALPGQKVAIVGPTGAGKTTMVNLLMKFYNINSGDIKIDGVSTKDLTRENIHDLFTMVLQDTWLFNGTIKGSM